MHIDAQTHCVPISIPRARMQSVSETTAETTGGNAVASFFRQPVLWGGLATAGFYTLVHFDILKGEMIERYFASHPVEYVSTALFFVGLAALAIKWIEVKRRSDLPEDSLLGPMPTVRQRPHHAELLLAVLRREDNALRETYLARRLDKALKKVKLKASADSLETELRNLADDDAYRAHQSYALVRIIVWAIPILGFLGTVIGITLAVAELKPTNLNEIGPVVAGLSVAFDTTALALALSIVLMFGMFFTTQTENKALAAAEARAETELIGRFEQASKASDDSSQVVRAATEELLRSMETIIERQAELWRSTIDAAHQHWQQLSESTEQQLAKSLETALVTSLQTHHEHLRQTEHEASGKLLDHWDQMHHMMQENATAVSAQQGELRKHGELMLKVVDATGRVIQLEDALNQNLDSLAGSVKFEETINTLNAAVSLFTARLGAMSAERSKVDLKSDSKGQAA